MPGSWQGWTGTQPTGARPQATRQRNAYLAIDGWWVAGGRDRYYSPELFRQTAERIPHGRLRLYPDKGHAGVLTSKPAIREIVAFLRTDDQPRT